MTVAAQKDLFTKRYRRVRELDPLESHIHKSLVQLLRLTCRPGVEFYHCANGELRDPKTAAKLKAMGVKPGVADLQFIWGELMSVVGVSTPMIVSRVLFLELKARGRKQTEEQIAFEASVTAKGCTYELADNIDDAICILKRYRVLR